MISLANAKKFLRYARHHGTGAAFRTSLRYLQGRGAPSPTTLLLQVAQFENLYCDEFGATETLEALPVDSRMMQWLIPSFGFGSGGHMTIFRMINHLSEMGYPQRIVVLPPHAFKSAEAARRAIFEWYMPLNADIVLGVEEIQPCYALIATGHQTAHTVAAYRAARHKLYFVQDFEPMFYPVSSHYYLAEGTYKLGLTGVTAGSWLAEKLHDEYGMQTHALSFGVNHNIYHAAGRHAERPQKQIVYYARHGTPRRLVELGLLALSRLAQRGQDFHVRFIGGDMSGLDFPFSHENLGELPEGRLGDVFRASDLGLVLSGTNLSLMPLELAACKCSVMMNDGPNTRWLLDESEAWFAPADPNALAQAIEFALTNEKARLQKVEAAWKKAQTASWPDQARSMANFIETL